MAEEVMGMDITHWEKNYEGLDVSSEKMLKNP